MSSKTRVSIIGTVGLPAKYGGFETLADHLVTKLADKYDITVYCSKKRYTEDQRISSYKGANLKYIDLDANGIQSIAYDTISIIRSLLHSDVLLILGVAGAWILPFVRLFTNKKIVISIDGIEWKRDKWSTMAKLYLRWAEKMAVKYSHADISDNESIQDYTALRYGSVSKVIAYGADHTLQVIPNKNDLAKYSFLSDDYAFKVCRIEPENNVHLVLSAFSKIPEKIVVIVGNWDANTYGQELKEKYSNFKNIIILDPIYNQRSIDLLRGNASLYVHGHSAGGTNPSLVEAMYLGLPIISYGVSYNRTTTHEKALYFKTEDELIQKINKSTSYSLNKIGKNLKNIAKSRYTWDLIAQQYDHLFQEVCANTKKLRVVPNSESLSPDALEDLGVSHLKTTKLIFER